MRTRRLASAYMHPVAVLHFTQIDAAALEPIHLAGFGQASSASTSGSPWNLENVPASAIYSAALRNPSQAVRASVPPTLIRRTPSCAASATVVNGALISRFTGFGDTAATIADTCSRLSMRGA